MQIEEREEEEKKGIDGVLKGLQETTQQARVLLTMCAEVTHASKFLRGGAGVPEC